LRELILCFFFSSHSYSFEYRLQASVSEFSADVHGAGPKDVMDILLLSQYFDTLAAVGANSLILEHDPATVANLQAQVNKSFLKATADPSSSAASRAMKLFA